MKRTVEVCFAVLILLACVTTSANAQATAPALQPGVSVKMAVTTSAVAVPDADAADALIVTVTANHMVFLGTERIEAAALGDRLEGIVSGQRDKKVYIKADARTPYANVAQVLRAARKAGVEAPILLTTQHETARSTPVPPRGLEVFLSSQTPEKKGPVAAEVLHSENGPPTVKIRNEAIGLAALKPRLEQIFESGAEKEILLTAKGPLSFAEIAAVTDVCRAAGAKVFLLRAER